MTIRINWNGHFNRGRLFQRDKYTREWLEEIHEQLERDTCLMRAGSCPYCGDNCLKGDKKGNSFKVDRPCSNPLGRTKVTFELNVPSGKLVVANDLRKLFPVLKDYDVNTTKGTMDSSTEAATVGLAFGFVGNTCPGVHRMNHGKGHTYKVVSLAATDRWNGKKYIEVKRKTPLRSNGKRVAGICTDLWWYCMADLDDCEQRSQQLRGTAFDLKEWDAEIVDVKPGVYRFVHDCGVNRDKPGDTVFATFKWVREPDDTGDRLQKFLDLYESPGRVIQQLIRDWPSLYSGVYVEKDLGTGTKFLMHGPERTWEEIPESERTGIMARVADHLMAVNGTGTEWHPGSLGGWPLTKVDADIPDMPVPDFETLGQIHWYPISHDYCDMARVPKFAPEWARLAFNCLRSMLKFGWQSHPHEYKAQPPEERVLHFPEEKRTEQLKVLKKKWADEEKEALRCRKEASKVYRTFRARHPEIIAERPEFDSWWQSQPDFSRPKKAKRQKGRPLKHEL